MLFLSATLMTASSVLLERANNNSENPLIFIISFWLWGGRAYSLTLRPGRKWFPPGTSSGASKKDFGLFGIIHIAFPLEWWIPCTFCSRIQTTRPLPSGRIHSLVHVHSSRPVPILDSFTLVFFSLVILIYVCMLLNWGDSARRTRDLFPPQIIITGTSCTQTSQISHFHGAVLFWCFAPGLSGEVWLRWCVFHRCSNLIIVCVFIKGMLFVCWDKLHISLFNQKQGSAVSFHQSATGCAHTYTNTFHYKTRDVIHYSKQWPDLFMQK